MHLAFFFFMNYSNPFPSTVLLIMDFKYPKFSISIQFCQLYHFVFMFPQFLICLHKEKICSFSIKNSIFAEGRAVMAPNFPYDISLANHSVHQKYNFHGWWMTAVHKYPYLNNCEISNVGNVIWWGQIMENATWLGKIIF
jgi:hypothetical protein